jgi:hypothetical protein
MKRRRTGGAYLHAPNIARVVTCVAALCVLWSSQQELGAANRSSPIGRAIDFLRQQQVVRPFNMVVNGVHVVDFPGDWPQYFALRGVDGFRVRDVSPFTVGFIHHALAYVTDSNRQTLGLRPVDVVAARDMRRRAVTFMRGFESPSGAPDAATFGFWPYDTYPATPDPLLTFLMTLWLQGPFLGGQRVPINLPIYPSTLAIPTDADVTATTYATLLDDAILDGGRGTRVAFERFFADWRDVGVVPRRSNPAWLAPASGTFLTWLTYRDPPVPVFPNDVDLVVNGNVLYALARYNRLAVPGVQQAITYINEVASLGLHREHMDEISQYYPDNLAFQYVVSRAFHEGPVPALRPAMRILADDLEASVLFREDGSAYWDQGDPHLNTAFAVLTLLNAGRETPIIDRAIDYLVSEQNALGGFDEATFFVGRAGGGQVFEFASASFTTAMVLEALARHDMAHCARLEWRLGALQDARCR